MASFISWFVFAAIVVVLSVVIIRSLRKPLQQFLSVNSYISPAKDFYTRAFTAIILLAALSGIAEAVFPTEAKKSFMEYLWWITNSLDKPLFYISLWMLLYVAILTVLYAVLGRYRD